MSQPVLFTHDICTDLDALATPDYDRIFLLTDTTTEQLCRPRLNGSRALQQAGSIVIGSTDTHKTLATLADVWTALGAGGASRRSLLVCLGGGMVTDLGGFAASAFKRGIDFINIPTTLLAMVDAAVGGKTGINFGGLKNEIGAFCESRAVIVDTEFLRTLDAENLRSGYAEMLKHALLDSTEMWARHLDFPLYAPDYDRLQELVAENISVKRRIVMADPRECGVRKALNLGHTMAHAFESLALEEGRPVLHGYAVAWGLVCELYLCCALCGFPVERMRQTVSFILRYYGRFSFTCKDYDRLLALMLHDKKNVAGRINFTLLGDVGDIRLDAHAERCLILEAFDFLREG